MRAFGLVCIASAALLAISCGRSRERATQEGQLATPEPAGLQRAPEPPKTTTSASGAEHPVALTSPVVVKGYFPLDCGASQLSLIDGAGRNLYLYNKPFGLEIYLSTKSCTENPDMSCSVNLARDAALRQALEDALTSFAEEKADKEIQRRIRAEGDFTKLTKDEALLRGTLFFVDRVESARTAPLAFAEELCAALAADDQDQLDRLLATRAEFWISRHDGEGQQGDVVKHKTSRERLLPRIRGSFPDVRVRTRMSYGDQGYSADLRWRSEDKTRGYQVTVLLAGTDETGWQVKRVEFHTQVMVGR